MADPSASALPTGRGIALLAFFVQLALKDESRAELTQLQEKYGHMPW